MGSDAGVRTAESTSYTLNPELKFVTGVTDGPIWPDYMRLAMQQNGMGIYPGQRSSALGVDSGCVVGVENLTMLSRKTRGTSQKNTHRHLILMSAVPYINSAAWLT